MNGIECVCRIPLGYRELCPSPRCPCYGKEAGTEAHTEAARRWYAGAGPQTALRQLDQQMMDPAEVRSMAYERQRQRYGRITGPAAALRWLGEHTATHAGPGRV